MHLDLKLRNEIFLNYSFRFSFRFLTTVFPMLRMRTMSRMQGTTTDEKSMRVSSSIFFLFKFLFISFLRMWSSFWAREINWACGGSEAHWAYWPGQKSSGAKWLGPTTAGNKWLGTQDRSGAETSWDRTSSG